MRNASAQDQTPAGEPPPWTLAGVRQFLALYGLMPRQLSVEKLESWWFNLVLKIDADGEHLVLRRYGITPREEVRWELAVLDHLRKNDFPTIAPLLRVEGGSFLADFLERPAILYPFIEGRNGCDLEWAPAMRQTVAAVARLHALTERLAVPYPRVQSGTEPRRMIRGLAALVKERGMPATALLGEVLEAGQRTAQDFENVLTPHAAQLPRGVVHHDAHCKNVLFRDGQVVALIDFDDAYHGYVVADVVRLLESWAGDWGTSDPPDLARAAQVVGEYERYRPLTQGERELLPLCLSLFLLSDAAGYVQGEIERGRDAATAVEECSQYQRYQALKHDRAWYPRLQRELWG